MSLAVVANMFALPSGVEMIMSKDLEVGVGVGVWLWGCGCRCGCGCASVLASRLVG